MANFFDEDRVRCSCGSELFEEVKSYMLLKEKKNVVTKVPYKEYHRCLACGKLSDKE